MDKPTAIKSLLLEENHYFSSLITKIGPYQNNPTGFDKILGNFFNSRTQVLKAIDNQDYLAPTIVEMPSENQMDGRPSMTHLSHALVIIDAKIADMLALRELQDGIAEDSYQFDVKPASIG